VRRLFSGVWGTWLLVPVVLSVLGACAVGRETVGPLRPAPILHLVYFHLQDPTQAEDLLMDCQQQLASIPGVVSYAAGMHLETGRDSVDGDYDLALLVGFADVEAYQDYLVHANHLELLATWRDRLASYTIHDVLDQPVP
jgi:hypothetical protein